ncbi:type 1 glutamine amidotransferase domain-containing protein [Kozakia baliensis]|uniref:type 1 glutamine amidotransferase domain-containing protein n=1 Tax=Kozakia baliensis TaxID=153496 RepID=UPI00087D2BDA|nr:type 1 glutamine amidotransferase domain-containing protein [Kozakia baliensis]AOX21355.1 thiamine biosynthesis protein ThiJ [Kozakia baliensis]
MSATQKILVVVTSINEFEDVGYRTGLWLGELTHFWDELAQAGYHLDIVSPLGGMVPIDPESLIMAEMGAAMGLKGDLHRHYEDRGFMNRLKTTGKIADADVARYDAIYLTGGHGAMFDFPESAALAELVVAFYSAGKFVTAVCHGPAGLLRVKLPDGRYLIDGRKVTGFSWREEVAIKRDNAVPFSLEDELRKRGGDYSTAVLPFVGHVVVDDHLITGQNPASARGVGVALVKRLGRRLPA